MKISGWAWLVAGVCIAVAIFSVIFFRFVQPNNTEAAAIEQHAEALAAEEAKLPRAKERVENAAAKVEEISAQWQMVVAEKTKPADLGEGGINLGVNPWQLTKDARTYRDNVQRDVNRQVKRGGVTVVGGPLVPQPSESHTDVLATYFNYPAATFPVAIFNLGTVTVEGSYEQIKANVQAWSSMPGYLATTDGLSIQGTGRELTATYNLVVVSFIRGESLPPSIVPTGQPATNVPGGGNAAPAPAPGGRGPGIPAPPPPGPGAR